MGFFDMFPKEMVATTIDQSRLESERKAGRDAAIAADEAKKAEEFAKEQRKRRYDHEKFIRNKNYEIKSFLWKRSVDLQDKKIERDELRDWLDRIGAPLIESDAFVPIINQGGSENYM